ncbi:MAG: hypothetical protein ACFB21_01955 [Opitutales bacterium]
MESALLAYIGPGLGAGVVGTILGLIAAFFLGVVALVWYPVKRMLKRKRGDRATAEPATVNVEGETPVKDA